MGIKQRRSSRGRTGIIGNLGSWTFTVPMILNRQRKWLPSYPGNLRNSLGLEKSTPKPSRCTVIMLIYPVFSIFSTKKLQDVTCSKYSGSIC